MIRNCYNPFFGGMFILFMAPFLTNKVPSIVLYDNNHLFDFLSHGYLNTKCKDSEITNGTG